MLPVNVNGCFDSPKISAAGGTVFKRLIPPFCGNSVAPPKIFQVDQASTSTSAPKNNFNGPSDCFTHVTDLYYTSQSTAHLLYLLRPLNYTWSTTAVASNTTTFTVAYDPGTWQTAGVYKYAVPGSTTVPAFANNTQSSGDIYAFQYADGTWAVDVGTTNTTGTTIVLTTGTANVVGATIPAYSPIYWFGVVGDTDPATGMIHPIFDSIANTNVTFRIGANSFGLWNSRHRSDPMIFHSSNGTDAGTLEVLAGYYSSSY